MNRNLGADIIHPLDSLFCEVLKFYLCLVKNGSILEVSVQFSYPPISTYYINHPREFKSKIYTQNSIICIEI